MIELSKYNIDPMKALEFIYRNLENLNELSKSVLSFTPFDFGEFYTFLPKLINKEQLYNFQSGFGTSKGIQENAIQILLNELVPSSDRISIFDAFDHDYDECVNWQFFNNVGLHFNKEVYFLVESKKADKDLLKHCFYNSDCIWHSLIVTLRSIVIKNTEKSIASVELEEIARNAKYVILRAYDQEGYIIWERNSF